MEGAYQTIVRARYIFAVSATLGEKLGMDRIIHKFKAVQVAGRQIGVASINTKQQIQEEGTTCLKVIVHNPKCNRLRLVKEEARKLINEKRKVLIFCDDS